MRIRLVLRIVLAACGLAIASVSLVETHGQPPDFQDMKKQFLRDMKTDQPEIRVKAVKRLSQESLQGAAELLIKRGFADPNVGVRNESLTGLRRMASNSEVREFLKDELTKSLRKPGLNQLSIEFIRSLTVTSDEGQQSEFLNYLNDAIGSPKFNLQIVMTAIEEDGDVGDADSVRSVALLAKANVFEKHFGYRRCVVQALTRIRRPEAIDVLIQLIGKTDGLVQYDAIQYLAKLTKQQHRDDHQSWAVWWTENREKFNIPALEVDLPEVEVAEGSDNFYKNPIHAKRVVFVLNTSDRLQGPPLASAKRDLMKTVEALPELVHFNIVTYACRAETWRPQLVPATSHAKQAAVHFIQEAHTERCNLPDIGLLKAYQFDTEAIYFHVAHLPTLNTINMITASNRIRRVSIHTIGLPVYHHEAFMLPLTMRSFAERNYGTYQSAK